MPLQYVPFEHIVLPRPIDRIQFIIQSVTDKKVLDLGCWDETALVKKGNHFWLHEEIAKMSSTTIGIDNSLYLPDEGVTYDKSIVIKGDITRKEILMGYDVDIIIAGELIEHLPNTLQFLSLIKDCYLGKHLIITTPNTTNISNCILALFGRESCHRDHLQVYSFKTLTTICDKSSFRSYRIIPYHVKFTEMILHEKGVRKAIVKMFERMVNVFEDLFPMLSGGYIIDISL